VGLWTSRWGSQAGRRDQPGPAGPVAASLRRAAAPEADRQVAWSGFFVAVLATAGLVMLTTAWYLTLLHEMPARRRACAHATFTELEFAGIYYTGPWRLSSVRVGRAARDFQVETGLGIKSESDSLVWLRH
jgi:hypothetical protein